MSHSFDHILDKAFHGQTVEALLAASPAALKGLSAADAQALETAFNIRSIAELADHRFIRRAQAILAAAGRPGHDPGPSPDWADFLAAAPLDYYQAHPAHRFRLDFGPVIYRGRLDGSARVLLIGQDPSVNEILAHRIFAGRSGQRVQGLLNKLGLTRSYTLINTFLYSVFGQFDSELRAISLEEPILAYRNAFLDRLAEENALQAVIAVGAAADHAVENWPGLGSLPVFHITHPAAPNTAALMASWNAALPGLQALVDPDDDGALDPELYGAGFKAKDQPPIPRFDLPFGLPDWHGHGSHGDRQGNKRIIWEAP
jgi:uracil-DNA glycosylase